MSESHRLYHVGYRDGWTMASLVERVREMDAVLVDVRFRSGYPRSTWSAARFTAMLGQQYRWIPALGNRNYRSDTAPIELANAPKGIVQVRALMQESSVVLMCACAQYDICHRRVVIEKMRAQLGDDLLVELLENAGSTGRLW